MRSHARRAAAQLGVELEAQLLEQLSIEWRSINYNYFRSALRMPIIRVSETESAPARWNGELRSLEVSRRLVLGEDARAGSWAQVIEALKRETARQFVDERLNVDPRNHEAAVRRIYRHLGVRARDSDHANDPRPPGTTRVLTRIDKLLALARSPNRHEAETAAATARRLMLKFNIRRAQSSSREAYSHRHLGRPATQLGEHDRRLAKILNEYFFVESAWLPVYLPREGRRGIVLEICGLEANLVIAEHVHTFVSRTALRLWTEYAHTSAAGARSRGDRRAFLAGVMKGFEDKLAAQDQELREQGLVWVPAPGLDAYFRRRNPRLQTVQPGSALRSDAYEHGNRAGWGIVLSQPVATRSSGGPPKALSSG